MSNGTAACGILCMPVVLFPSASWSIWVSHIRQMLEGRREKGGRWHEAKSQHGLQDSSSVDQQPPLTSIKPSRGPHSVRQEHVFIGFILQIQSQGCEQLSAPQHTKACPQAASICSILPEGTGVNLASQRNFAYLEPARFHPRTTSSPLGAQHRRQSPSF